MWYPVLVVQYFSYCNIHFMISCCNHLSLPLLLIPLIYICTQSPFVRAPMDKGDKGTHILEIPVTQKKIIVFSKYTLRQPFQEVSGF